MSFILTNILKITSIAIPLLISVAYFTIAERKIMDVVQRRRVSFIGLLQPFTDSLKLLRKKTMLPTNANIGGFLLSPSLSFIFSLIS